MELHTLGVDGGYTQDDVVDVARVLHRLDHCRSAPGRRLPLRAANARSEARRSCSATRSRRAAVEQTASRCSTSSPGIRRRRASSRRSWCAGSSSDTPPPALVDRAAARFHATDGDIREVVRTILTSPEFFAADAYRAKVKTPFEFVVSAVRATGTDVATRLPLAQTVRQLGMPLYICQPPTGYADRADAWVNTGALLNRMNFALALVTGRMQGLCRSAGSPPTDRDVTRSSSPLWRTTSRRRRSRPWPRRPIPDRSLALTLGSPEFQRR